MDTLSRILGFLSAVLMLLALGGVFLFENKLFEGAISPTSSTRSLSPESTATSTTGAHNPDITNDLPLEKSKTEEVVTPVVKKSVPVNTPKGTTITPTVSAPGALIIPNATPALEGSTLGGALEESEIIALTNKERLASGLKPLSFNAHLSVMATAKANDMIAKQYFAHVAPDGTDLSMLAKTYGYAYLNVGENLALGDFTSSEDVVLGWMNSPGHRANILNKSFTEIGVSAVIGDYEGRKVWYAVQEFGRPLSDCPPPDVSLKMKIERYQEEISALEVSLSNLKTAIISSELDRVTYNEKVEDYNALIESYNQLLMTTKQDIQLYNAQVEKYNTCAGN